MNTLFDKIWDAHVVTTVEDVFDTVLFRVLPGMDDKRTLL